MCSFPGCDRERRYPRVGLCDAHYMQKWKGQELKPLRIMGKWTLEKLLDRATPDGDCYNWVRKYGQVTYQGRVWGAHHLSYHLATGEDTTGRQIHHKCANARCVNPAHLELASNAANTLEMFARKDYEARIAALEAQVQELQRELDEARSVSP
ncbi:HNH endonuclease [Mycobacterium phage Ohno789]|nr:HNH endonuclease [Mycobacterium phage Ohno789]